MEKRLPSDKSRSLSCLWVDFVSPGLPTVNVLQCLTNSASPFLCLWYTHSQLALSYLPVSAIPGTEENLEKQGGCDTQFGLHWESAIDHCPIFCPQSWREL